MEVRIGHGAHAVLERNHAFKQRLIEELATQKFANICFIEGPAGADSLEIKCLGGDEVVVPESSFSTPGIPARIVDELTARMK
jgi:hypothetical protein